MPRESGHGSLWGAPCVSLVGLGKGTSQSLEVQQPLRQEARLEVRWQVGLELREAVARQPRNALSPHVRGQKLAGSDPRQEPLDFLDTDRRRPRSLGRDGEVAGRCLEFPASFHDSREGVVDPSSGERVDQHVPPVRNDGHPRQAEHVAPLSACNAQAFRALSEHVRWLVVIE